MNISGIENEHTHALAAAVLVEAYKRIGCTAYVDFMPGRRSLEWANEGRTDGDLARIKGTDKVYTNLIRIPTAVLITQEAVFTINETKPIQTWEDLRGLRIGIIRGIRFMQIGTRGMSPIQANDMTHLFSLLVAGRVTVAISVLDTGLIEISRNFKGQGIHLLAVLTQEAKVFHYINKEHAALVEPLDRALQEMEYSGVTERILDETRRSLAGK